MLRTGQSWSEQASLHVLMFSNNHAQQTVPRGISFPTAACRRVDRRQKNGPPFFFIIKMYICMAKLPEEDRNH